ncbi:hypothetical protein, partial [Muricoccus nepalensis]|uniref:hypothetical protein n=1 Tax=Muricoccus nepalensis TaxID=1854500 RepID=UPI0019D685FC
RSFLEPLSKPAADHGWGPGAYPMTNFLKLIEVTCHLVHVLTALLDVALQAVRYLVVIVG